MSEEMNFNKVLPYLTVDDGDAAIKFYEAAFDGECNVRMPSEDGRVMHASIKVNGGYVMLSDDIMDGGGGTRAPAKAGATTVTVHLEYEGDAQPVWDSAIAAGAEMVMPFEKQPWGLVYGKLRDPFGHVWSISGPASN
ncbi:MAG: VOC family protein [Hyphomonadaceae bacterium]